MIIFDLDGTLADCEHRRHFVDPEVDLKPIVSHPNYYAGSDGNIYSYNSRGSKRTGIPIILSPRKGKAGHKFVCLYKNDKPTTKGVHQLVCEAFHGKRPDGKECSHLDGIPDNNKPDNLAWETPSENQQRRFFKNNGDDGINNTRSFFKNKEQLLEILDLRSQGLSYQKIADKFGCSETCIKQICYGKCYKRTLAN